MVTGKETIKTGAWDPEEDDLLYYWQSKVGNKWSEVAKHIPGRTGQQCAQRWRHKVNPNIRRDKWTAEEDAKLIELVKTFGVGRWAEIARNCDGRTDQQCMGRWRRHLDPSIKRDSWSPEEDAKLRQLHAQYGTSWSRISKCLKGRTSQQCRARWHQINNGRSRSGAPAGSSSGGSGKQQAAGSKRSSQAGKRKPSRRRSDFSDSEEEEDEEAEVEDDDDGEAEEPPRGDQHLLQRKGGNGKGRSELDEEETAGAETLLQMAHLLRRESCEFEPPSLRRSDFITASTPPKRHHAPEHADALREADELSPSPFKRARSSRGALFGRPGAAGADAEDARELASSLGRSGRDAAAAIAAAAADDGMDSEEEPHAAAAGGGGRRASRLHAAAAEFGDAEGDSYMDAGVEEEEEDDEAAAGEDPILGFGLGSSSYPGPLPDPPARPSNASSLTACNADGAAAGSTAAAFLSPPPVARVPGSSSRWRESTGAMVTPRRPTAQQNLMNLLASPSFDRMAGYASPPSAGRTQPSAATLAALQSPQPSCVHEPFWTPFTGLFKDALFTRGTSATPDLPSGGKVRSGGGLFSPARLFSPGRKSNSASKALPRRSLLASPALERGEQQAEEARAAGAPAGTSAKAAAAACPADSAETGPSPAAACGLQAAGQQVNHRVVRRLDTHEAWGGPLAAASPAKGGSNTWAAAAAGSAVKPPKGDGLLGSGLSLFSPVKKQRVPLFSEGSGIHIGASPAKPEQAELPGCTLTIAPLTHDLPTSTGEAAGKACEGAGAVRAGSRALRRLQDELERGSGIAAAAAAAQQQLGSGKAAARWGADCHSTAGE
ncbi:hypothetical protein OEZ85_008671 [Tetradesmus obliquus]|uniref:Uncharacterized protein n=1 Tax=Tetradesmus obliquus TaxID=3088 RepID=A0ABY8TLK3_TETOB|nr:hypothetical protein OEZ85_008671 [Tetradesmus obliquus]